MLACTITPLDDKDKPETGEFLGLMYGGDYDRDDIYAVVRIDGALVLKQVHPSRIKFHTYRL